MNFQHQINKLTVFVLLVVCSSIQAENNILLDKTIEDITNIRLENIQMKVNISPHHKESVNIKVYGPNNEKNSLRIDTHGSELVVQQLDTKNRTRRGS